VRRTKTVQSNKQEAGVNEAYKAVKLQCGASGVDGQSIEQFEATCRTISTRSGTVSFGKLLSTAGTCCLHTEEVWRAKDFGCAHCGGPRGADVVKQVIEPDLEPLFLADSYGYTAGKNRPSMLFGVTRKRCWKYDWVSGVDIQGYVRQISTTR